MDIQAQVNQSIFEVKKITDPTGSSLLKEDLGIDSLQFIRIITKLTKKLGVDIFELSDQELASVKTVDQLISLFNKSED
ncbi:MAG: acyl carrier protein [Ginsengibacter sp.]